MKKFSISLFVLVALISCSKDDDNGSTNDGPNQTALEIATTVVSDITSNSAKSGGVITSDGGLIITERGVCVSTASNPSVNDEFTSDGGGIGTFESYITGLSPNTQYYVRAFAKNSSGVHYGDNQTFTTLAALFEGTYDEEESSYKHIVVLENGNKINYHFYSDPSVYIGHEFRGKYYEGDSWYQFFPVDGVGSSTVYVVKQYDENTIVIRRGDSYSDAYNYGQNITYTRH